MEFRLHYTTCDRTMNDKTLTTRTDPEVLDMLGARMRALRKAVGLTLVKAAEKTGLDRSTISGLEHGENATLLTLIRLLRAYGRLSALESFIPEPEVSPMSVLRSRGRKGGSGG